MKLQQLKYHAYLYLSGDLHRDLAVAPEASSEAFNILNKSTEDPVDSLPLLAYPDTNISVAMILSTKGCQDRIRKKN